MKEKIKIMQIECNWTMNNFFEKDCAGNSQSYWKGYMIFRPNNDGLCIGVVTDKEQEILGVPYTHLIVGTLVEDKGIALVKINVKDEKYDPIDFSLIFNEEEKRFEGIFSALTPVSCYRLGMAYLNYNEIVMIAEDEKKKILDNINKCEDILMKQDSLGKRYLQAIIEASKVSNEGTKAILQMYENVIESREGENEQKSENVPVEDVNNSLDDEIFETDYEDNDILDLFFSFDETYYEDKDRNNEKKGGKDK